MTNKEIRIKVPQDKPIKQDRFANGIRTLINESPLINAIQNATRADERERVISEILSEAEYWENYYPEEFEKFIDTLTSLKEKK